MVTRILILNLRKISHKAKFPKFPILAHNQVIIKNKYMNNNI